MQLPGIGYAVLWTVAVLGTAWSPESRFATIFGAFALFMINLWTNIGGGFSVALFITTMGIALGVLFWQVLELGAYVVGAVAALLENVATPHHQVRVPPTRTVNLRDVFREHNDRNDYPPPPKL